jgi:hypothetical protein
MPEPSKVGATAFFKLIGEAIQVGDTIFEDPYPLSIKTFRAIEIVHHASTDHGIQCHQWPLMLALHVRPSLFLVSFPEGHHGISAHFEIPFDSACRSSSQSTLAQRLRGSQAWREQVHKIGRCGSPCRHPNELSVYAMIVFQSTGRLLRRSCLPPSRGLNRARSFLASCVKLWIKPAMEMGLSDFVDPAHQGGHTHGSFLGNGKL